MSRVAKVLTVAGLMFWIVLIYALFFALSERAGGLDWISWKEENTSPRGRHLEVREEGEYGWFGSAKVRYDLPVRAGQFICVKVDADNPAYRFEVMIYWRAADPEIKSGSMVDLGVYPWNLTPGEWRCYEVRPLRRADVGEITDMVIEKAHWIAYGRGGVIMTPTLIVSEVDLGE